MLVIASNARSAEPCDAFFALLPNVQRVECEAAKLQPTSARSVKGRTIYTSDIRPAEARWRVLVVGGIHGDELSSTSVALHWIGLAQADPAQVSWRFIPALNPDGLLSRPARRMNAPRARTTPSDAEIKKMWLDLREWMSKRLPSSQTALALEPPRTVR